MALVFAFVAVAVGALVQGSVGFELALVVVPVLAIVHPEALPAVILLLASVVSPQVCLTNGTKLLGGLASGVMGTAGGVGGPPLALVYQDRSGPEIRATLAVDFVARTTLSLVALFLTGRVREEHVLLTLQLLPALILGLVCTRWISPLLDGRWLRPAVLLFAAVSSLAAVLSAS